MNVAPLQCDQFAFPQACTKRSEKERIPAWANFPDGGQELFGFLAGHSASLARRLFGFRKFAHLRRGIGFDDAIFEGSVENSAQRRDD